MCPPYMVGVPPNLGFTTPYKHKRVLRFLDRTTTEHRFSRVSIAPTVSDARQVSRIKVRLLLQQGNARD